MRTAIVVPFRTRRALRSGHLVAMASLAIASSAGCGPDLSKISFEPRTYSDSALVAPDGARLSIGDTAELQLVGIDGVAMWVPDRWTVTPSDAAVVDRAGRLVALRSGALTVTAIGSQGYPIANRSGRRSTAQLLVLDDAVPAEAVTVGLAGASQMCAVLSGTPRLLCWPGPLDGAYGLFPSANGGTGARRIITDTPDLRSLAGGSGHTCGLDGEGAAWCWGRNSYGNLGTGDTVPRSRPTLVVDDHRWARLVSADFTTCALERDATLWCWGEQGTQFFADSSAPYFARPQRMAGGTTFLDVDMSGSHICAVRTDSTAVCWGEGTSGGLGQQVTRSRVPLEVPLGTKVTSISVGVATCALTPLGVAICWGLNFTGGLARPASNDALPPAPVTGVPPLTRVVSDGGLTCGLTVDGEAWCWGARVLKERPSQRAEASPTPSPVPGGDRFVDLVVTGPVACGITQAHALLCWGENIAGYVGDGTHVSRVRPRAVRSPDP